MNYLNTDWRDRRTFLHQGISFGPMHYTIANYSTNAKIVETSDMKAFDESILTKIHSIPDPLKKNLGDSVIGGDKNNVKDPETPLENKEFNFHPDIPPENMNTSSGDHRTEFYPSLTGITSFFSNVFGAISGAMFYRRPKSPASQYYDCFDSESHNGQKMAPDSWQTANSCDQNKKRALDQSSAVNDNMNNCRAAVAQVEDKLNAVRSLLKNKPVPNNVTPRVRYRRPRKLFVEPTAVTESTENELPTENYVSVANDDFIECIALPNNQNQVFCEIEAPIMKTQTNTVPETTEIVKIIPEENTVQITPTKEEEDSKKEVISACEDKMARLKAMLLDKKKKPTKSTVIETVLEPVKTKPPINPSKVIPIDKKQDKNFKNPNRLTDKRKKSKLKKNIKDDMSFANEIDSEDISSVENSPTQISTMQRIPKSIPIKSVETEKEYFDEVKGRFHSASTDSDDSFQIVFTDSPKLSRLRKPSECDSEDSFIVFEDSPDSCYTSNEVFSDNPSSEEMDPNLSDTDSDISDSGCAVDVCKLSHNFSRTVSDLTDDSLYEDPKRIELTGVDIPLEEDEVDCALQTFDEIDVEEEPSAVEVVTNTGLLINEEKKLRRKGQPPKKVTFDEKPPKVHVMRVWSFAARQARAGHWERHALDRDRFKRRIADVDMAVSWVLKPQHRRRVMFQRFMPWWNQQKRIELAEKKLRAQQEKIKKDQEGIIEEEFYKEIETIGAYDDIFFEHLVQKE